MNTSILPEGSSVTFADYFKLTADIEDVLAAFGYSFRIESSKLPRKALGNGHFAEVRRHLEEVLPYLSLTSETARREFLIAPVLMEVALYARAKIKVEYPLAVDERLKGTLDYFIRGDHNFLVVEAKGGELKKGFTQLAVELVALDQWAKGVPEPRLYGAVSMGDVWKFGYLDREEKRVTEDLNTYSVPKELEEVVEILATILTE